jgi:hypothetical protein
MTTYHLYSDGNYFPRAKNQVLEDILKTLLGILLLNILNKSDSQNILLTSNYLELSEVFN